MNGQWLDKTEIPEDKSRYGAFSKLYDARQSELNAIYVSQSGLGLPDRDYYLYLEEGERYKAIRQQYQDYMTELLVLAGQPEPEQVATGIMALETRLAEVQWSRVERRDPIKAYNKMTVADANQLMGDFDFSRYLRQAGVDIDQVIVRQPGYFEKLSSIISGTDISTWKTT